MHQTARDSTPQKLQQRLDAKSKNLKEVASLEKLEVSYNTSTSNFPNMKHLMRQADVPPVGVSTSSIGSKPIH